MLFAGWEVCIVKNCDQGLENAENTEKAPQASVTVTVVRDRKIQTALRTNQIVGFITGPT